MAKTATAAALPSPKQLGSALRELRTQRQLSQPKLAERAKISMFTLCRIEKATQRADLETLRRLCAAMGVTVTQLLQKAEQI